MDALRREFGLDPGTSSPTPKEEDGESFIEKAWALAKWGNDVWTAIGFAIAAIGFLVSFLKFI